MAELLLIVDPQNDFIDGSLAVPGAKQAMDRLAAWLQGHEYGAHLVTLDWHPANHGSFKENGGIWPVHCLNWSAGAAIYDPLLRKLNQAQAETYYFTKGLNPEREEYSIFQNELARDAVAEIVRKHDKVHICGIAGDVCVLNTLKDGIDIFGPGKFEPLLQFSPSLDGGKALYEEAEKLKICGK